MLLYIKYACIFSYILSKKEVYCIEKFELNTIKK